MTTEPARRRPVPGAIPARAGVGLKPAHGAAILGTHPDVGFFEVHAENYMGAGGPPHRLLEAVRERYPLSVHGVGLSIGGAGPLDRSHLARLRAVVERYRPGLVSEHLAWSTHAGGYLNDLLPVPLTEATLARVAGHVDEVQDALGRRILVENPSSYLAFDESTIPETEFLGRLVEGTGCALLLDVNNVAVSAANLGYDPHGYLDAFPIGHAGEIHLAGYDEEPEADGGRLLIDAHGSAVRPDVWPLLSHALALAGPLPVLVEWDNDVPDWPVLHAEAMAADAVLAACARQPLRAGAGHG
ncbi:MAG: DUF692 domain-containing protein [Thalassobaculum sp.]|uniref:MNIO family bufferin maturase n=1 Tax=Thalassobaculum sp. TaxID=2022740 RepID=UPI0032EB285C